MTILLVDDLRTFADGRECVIARSSAAAIKWLEENPDADLDEVWLDHDLGGADTGMKVVEWLEANTPPIGLVVVHSSNPPGARRMLVALERAGYMTSQHYDTWADNTWTWIPPSDAEWDPGVPA